MDGYLPALPALSRGLDASASSAQLTLTTCMLGLACGQLVAGPLSDAHGRRRPLLVGLAAYAAMSLACALAPTVWALAGFRLAQGLAGAAGIVIARAVARDLYSGHALVRFFGLLMVVTAVAPILAPILGAALLHVSSWRGVFYALTGVGVALFLATALGLRETLPPERRRPAGAGSTVRAFRLLLSDRVFVGYVLSAGFAFAAMFAYIAGSPFVLEDIHGVSPQLFSLVFAGNAFGIILAARLGTLVARRAGPRRALACGLLGSAGGGVGVLIGVVADAGLAGLLPAFFVVVSSMGLVGPSATALALADHADMAGSASALLGVTQFVIGPSLAPLVGVAGTRTALPMALVMAVVGVAAAATYLLLARHRLGQRGFTPA